MYPNCLEGLLRPKFPGSHPRISDSVGLRWGQEFASLIVSQVIQGPLVWRPYSEDTAEKVLGVAVTQNVTGREES